MVLEQPLALLGSANDEVIKNLILLLFNLPALPASGSTWPGSWPGDQQDGAVGQVGRSYQEGEKGGIARWLARPPGHATSEPILKKQNLIYCHFNFSVGSLQLVGTMKKMIAHIFKGIVFRQSRVRIQDIWPFYDLSINQ